MRTEEERLVFCGTLIDAARRLGIAIAYFSHKDQHRYIWGDNITGAEIVCPVAGSEKDALELACESLVSYLNPKHNDQGQPNPS